MGADLFESYVGSIIASLALAATGTAFLLGVDESRVDIDVDFNLAFKSIFIGLFVAILPLTI